MSRQMRPDIFAGDLKVLRWINIIAGITLTLVVFCFLCCTPRKQRVSVLFVTNLLISNLVLICSFVPLDMVTGNSGVGGTYVLLMLITVFLFALMIGLVFRMCIAVERYMIIAHPPYVRKTWTSVLACVGPWVVCVVMFCIILTMRLVSIYLIMFLVLLPILVSFIIVVLTIVALPAASSVPIEEKRRTVGVLALLLVDYILLIISAIILFVSDFESVPFVFLVLFTVFVDLALSVLMFKGPVDRFLARLCYCMTDNSVTTNQPSLENGGGGVVLDVI